MKTLLYLLDGEIPRLTWKTQLQEGAMDLFVTAAERQAAAPDVQALYAKIGQLAMENDFLADALGRIPDASAKR